MEILLLFILNIFTGAMIYLLLSLKIERTTSTFQEKKLKKEMGEIITEFNSTAERNITLLENKIAALKRLMNENGLLKSMDIILDQQPKTEGVVPVQTRGKDRSDVSPDIITKKSEYITEPGLDNIIGRMHILGREDGNASVPGTDNGNIRMRTGAGNKAKSKSVVVQNNGKYDAVTDAMKKVDYIIDEKIEIIPERVSDTGNDENVAELFINTDNKYALIAELHNKGYSVEELSEYSGLPSGEVKLVISLNN